MARRQCRINPKWPHPQRLEVRGSCSATDIPTIAQQRTVRLFGDRTAGSGVIVGQAGSVYSVLTNWHVVADRLPVVMTADGRRNSATQVRRIGAMDLAIVKFRSGRVYCVAEIASTVALGESVYAAGFPLYGAGEMTLALGIRNLRVTEGQVSLQLSKPLQQGYRLGYSNLVVVGMSGGPLFNGRGQLVGVNGRVADRDPAFGVYAFEDGTEPEGALLETIVRSSLGIPVDLDLVQQF